MFVRTKTIKAKKYAYLVENRWTKRGARQKVVGYLGAIESVTIGSKEEFHSKSLTFSQIVDGLIVRELEGCGFLEQNGRWIHGDVVWEPKMHTLRRHGKKVCLKINEGWLGEATLNRLYHFVAKGKPRDVALRLANSFVIAGIEIPKEVFIDAYQKIGGKRIEF